MIWMLGIVRSGGLGLQTTRFAGPNMREVGRMTQLHDLPLAEGLLRGGKASARVTEGRAVGGIVQLVRNVGLWERGREGERYVRSLGRGRWRLGRRGGLGDLGGGSDANLNWVESLEGLRRNVGSSRGEGTGQGWRRRNRVRRGGGGWPVLSPFRAGFRGGNFRSRPASFGV